MVSLKILVKCDGVIRFPSTSGSFWAASSVEIKSCCQSDIASVSERSDDQPPTVAQIFVSIFKTC